MPFTVAILYAPDGRRPLSLVRVNDRELLGVVAERAILEAEASARRLQDDDPVLGALQLQEVTKLRHVLLPLLPKSASHAPTNLM